MKKLSVKLLSLIITFLLILPLVFSCGEETPAQESKPTVEKSFEEMSKKEKAGYILKSGILNNTSNMLINGKVVLSGTVNETVPVTVEVKTTELELTNTEDGYLHNARVYVKAKSPYSSSTAFIMLGYQNGKMYIFSSANGDTTRQWTPISQADYKEYLKTSENSLMTGLGGFNFMKGACTKSENGNYIATYSKASKDLIGYFNILQNSYGSVFESPTIEDVVYTLELTPDLKLLSITVDLVYSTQPNFVFSVEVSVDHDNISFEKIDLEDDGYVRVDDLLDQLEQ